MIVDCHTQIWEAGRGFPSPGATVSESLWADATRYRQAVDPVDRAIVLAFKSRYLETEVSNRFVADYVRRFESKLIGFAGVDPTDDACLDELGAAQEELGLKGVVVSPALQDFHPSDTRAMHVYEECLRRRMPVVFEQDHRHAAAKLEFARPMLLDEVAREFPDLRLVVSHFGFPWVQEAVVLLGKHANVFADVAGLLPHPWVSYNALMTAYEYGVMDKLLFASDFPYRSPAACIEALYSINQVSGAANFVTIPREQLRGIVERDSLALLGIEPDAPPARRRAASVIMDDE